MFQVYTEKDFSEFTKSMIGEFKDIDEAIDAAEKAIKDKEGLRYIIEETTGHFNSWGELETRVVLESK